MYSKKILFSTMRLSYFSKEFLEFQNVIGNKIKINVHLPDKTDARAAMRNENTTPGPA